MASRLKKTADQVYDIDRLGKNAPFLVENYANVLNIVDEAMEIVGECLKLQLTTLKGGRRREITPQNLYLITKSLALIKVVYGNHRALPAPDPEVKPSYEEMIREANSETKQ